MKKIFSTKSKIPLYVAMLIPFFTGFGQQVANVITVVELLIAIYYFDSKEFFLITPIMCIYYSRLLVYGESLGGYNLFMWLCFIRMIKERYVSRTKLKPIVGLGLLLIYSSFVMVVWLGMWNGLNYAILCCGTVYVALNVRDNEDLKLSFRTVTVAMCLSATAYGIYFVNIKGVYENSGELINYTGRYCGTMGDPNYMAFFYCIAAVYIVFEQKINLLKKGFLLCCVFFATAITGSLTALISIFAVLIIYIFLGKERSIWTKITAIIILLSFGIFLYYALFTNVFNIKIFTVFQARISEKMEFATSGQYALATSGRTEYSGEYVEYLLNQNFLRVLFGGYQVNAMGLAGDAYNTIRFAAHNTYVDVVMTCGLVGLTVFVGHLINSIRYKMRLWKRYSIYQELSEAIVLVVAAIFIAGLSCFPSTNYMLFLML